jgi:iron(III) transport system ATP-binding protein
MMTPSQASTPRSRPYLRIRNVTKAFNQFVALRNVSLDIDEGEFVCILGPSGCGKTTLLRIIAGLDEQNGGQIVQNGTDVSRLPPARRDSGIVFQSYALFPNLTVQQNVAYGLENGRLSRAKVAARVGDLLALVGLPEVGGRYPAQLSGGQQQRVALARALALSPSLLLLDEPLSALDARVRANLRGEVAALQRRLGVTTIMVTHDQEEALTMADRIVIMKQGEIVQVGTPQEMYQSPATPFVADFVGAMNFLPAVVTGGENGHSFACCATRIAAQPTLRPMAPGSEVYLGIRPEEVRVLEDDEVGPNTLFAELAEVEFIGPGYRMRLILPCATGGDTRITAYLPANQGQTWARKTGARLPILLPADQVRVFASPVDGPQPASVAA